MKQNRTRRKPAILTVCIAMVCAACLILIRSCTQTVIQVNDIPFAYTDIFVIISAGIGGMGCGLLTFTILFIGEFVRVAGNTVLLFSAAIYLILVLITAHMAYKGWYRGVKKPIIACLIETAVLSLLWLITFTVVMPNMNESNAYSGIDLNRS